MTLEDLKNLLARDSRITVIEHDSWQNRKVMVKYPAYKVAAAHVAPVFLDTDRSIDKACSVIQEAADNGARLIAFPESFVPGFPIWAALEAPIRTHELFKRLAASAIKIDGPD